MYRLNRIAVLLAGIGLAFAALAQPAPDTQQNQADPPGRVARLAFIHGDVSFVPAGENDWVEAQINRPLVTGDKLWTDRGSRAELEIGAAAMRMDQNTSFDFLNLDDNTAQVELTQGSLNLRVRRLYDGQTYEVDTPTLAFVANRVGEFRIDVQANGQSTTVSVLHGGGDVYGEGGARFHVEEGQNVAFNDPQLQNYQTSNLPPPDAFDDFCLQRDKRWDGAPSRRYVSEEVIGYQDLDDYGSWTSDVPEYGNVWYPTTVAVGWSPYHYGHWAWVGAYGWSWVDEAPWGFAPFHYGRWAYIGGRWGWCPGPIAVRPVYAPALVAFVGVGGGVGVGFSVGGPIGWFPLGYHDVYFPAYHVSHNYFTNVNVSNTVINNTVINNYYGNYSRGNVNYGQINYANRGVAGAVTAVPASAFVGARPVAAAAVPVTASTFANARVSGFAAVAPTRASLAPATAARAVPAATVVNRPIVAATKPPAPAIPFSQHQNLLTQNPGQPLAVHQLHAATPTGVGAAGAARASNIKVVTQTGTPIRTAAPVLPKTGLSTSTGNSTLPAVQRTTTTGTPTNVGGKTAVTGGQAEHFDSSRFAHPNGSVNTNTSTGNQKVTTGAPVTTTTTGHGAATGITTHTGTGTPSKSTLQTEQQVKGGAAGNSAVSNYGNRGYGNNTTGGGQPEYHKSTQHNDTHTNTTTTTTPQTYTPTNKLQQPTVHPTGQAQQSGVQNVIHTPPPPPPPPKTNSGSNNKNDKGKDDDKKHGGG